MFCENGVNATSALLFRMQTSLNNKLFKPYFEIPKMKLVPNDGAAYLYNGLSTFVRIVIWIRGRKPADVTLFRISADSGRGDINVSFQMMYKDDSIYTALDVERGFYFWRWHQTHFHCRTTVLQIRTQHCRFSSI